MKHLAKINNRLRYIWIVLILLSTSTLMAQKIDRQNISFYSQIVSNSSFQVSSTAGQIAYSSSHGNSFILTQGFQQQSAELSSVESIFQSQIKWFPNPTDGEIHYNFGQFLFSGKIRIIDSKGAVVQEVTIVQKNTGSLNLSYVNAGIYYLEFFSTEGLVAKYKLSKF